MTTTKVSIGQVKRDISELVNRVAYGHEQIILTSRGRPKAALISIEDFDRLNRLLTEKNLVQWTAWQAESKALASEITARRQGEPLDSGQLWEAAKADLEARDDHLLNH